MERKSQTERSDEKIRKTDKQPLTILGVGNVLCSDDGLGPAVVARLKSECHGDGVSIVDGGTLGLSLLPLLEDSESVILVDAVRTDDPPGTLVELKGEDVLPAVRLKLSPHQVGVADLLDAARLRAHLPERLILVGIVPESIDLGFGLTEPVSKSVPELIGAIHRQADTLGYRLKTGGDDERRGVGVPGTDDVRLRPGNGREPAESIS